MPNLAERAWLPAVSDGLVAEVASRVASSSADEVAREISDLVAQNRRIHDHECVNLNPAANTMNPRAEAMLAGVHHPGGDGTVTDSQAFALDAGKRGGHDVALHLRRANLLTSAIGLPHDGASGVRFGTNETARWGMTTDHMAELATLVATALRTNDPAGLAAHVSEFRQRFDTIQFCRP